VSPPSAPMPVAATSSGTARSPFFATANARSAIGPYAGSASANDAWMTVRVFCAGAPGAAASGAGAVAEAP
jgi:hypothetical protein